VTGDRYGGEWPREQFRKRGIAYRISEQSKSELYVELLPHINSRRVELLDHQRLFQQLIRLERRTGRGTGRDVVDHPRGEHDDLANSAAGALLTVTAKRNPLLIHPSVLAISPRGLWGGLRMRDDRVDSDGFRYSSRLY